MSKPIVFKMELANCDKRDVDQWRSRSAINTLTLLDVWDQQPNAGNRVVCVLNLSYVEEHDGKFYGNFVVVPGDATNIVPLFNLDGLAPSLSNGSLGWVLRSNTEDSELKGLSYYAERVLGWSGDRGIITNGTLTAQFLKYDEEMGELAAGVARHTVEPVVDAIGDCLVVLTNIMALAGINPVTLLDHYTLDDSPEDYDTAGLVFFHRDTYNNVFDYIDGSTDRNRKGPQPGDRYEYDPLIPVNDEVQGNVGRRLACSCISGGVLECLDMLAQKHGTTLAGCFRHAWQQIRFRKGFLTPEGVFVKEE